MLALKERVSQAGIRGLAWWLRRERVWPVVGGAYRVGDPNAPVAICTLTSNEIVAACAGLPGVAIAGRIYTPNLGIEQIIVNLTTNPYIRFLLVCGRESPIFQPGQALESLCLSGITAERRIADAEGYYPVLSNISPGQIEVFRQQVELVNLSGQTDLGTIRKQVRALVDRNPGPFDEAWTGETASSQSRVTPTSEGQHFRSLRPGGHRQPLTYDPKGFFVITLNSQRNEIVVRHYLPDNTPAHEMHGRLAEPILLGLLREGLISQMSHAGYLGHELGKAETALRLGLAYEQDQSLRAQERLS